MGVEYRHYVVPVEPAHRPSAERIVKLVAAMERDGWLLAPRSEMLRKMTSSSNFKSGSQAAARKTGASFDDEHCERWSKGTPLPYPLDPGWLRARKRAIHMVWPFEDVFEHGLRYHLTRAPYERRWVYFSYEIQWSRYFLELWGENIRSASPKCPCGGRLELTPEGSVERAVGPFVVAYRRSCPSCHAPVDPKRFGASFYDEWKEQSARIPGGALHRFALVVECGKNLPEAGAPCGLHPELLATVEKTIGCPFKEVGAVH